jgi:hypothetical protein
MRVGSIGSRRFGFSIFAIVVVSAGRTEGETEVEKVDG